MIENFIEPSLLMYFGFSPGRMRKLGHSDHSFESGVFLSSSANIACNYAADWTARTPTDKTEFMNRLIQSEFEDGEPEALGFVVENDNGTFELTEVASADYILSNWSDVEIMANLVRPNLHLNLFPTGALVYPLLVSAVTIETIDANGSNWDDIPYGSERLGIASGNYSTNKIIELLRGMVDAVWFKNIYDWANVYALDSGDTMFVYSPKHLHYAISGNPVSSCVESP